MTTPTYVYKIVPESAAPPNPLPDRLPVSALDEKDGFIHLSTATQVAGTLNLFFANDRKIYLLRLKYEQHRNAIKWENQQGEGTEGQEGFFPHLYNGNNLGEKEIESVSEVIRGDEEGAKWDDALASLVSLDWLVY